MDNHKAIEELIQKYLDGEITDNEHTVLSAHISYCQDCALLFDELVSLNSKIFTLKDIIPNHNFNEQVLHRILTKRISFGVKIATVLSGVWIISFLAVIVLPNSYDILIRLLMQSPMIVKFVDKFYFLVVTLARIFLSLAQKQFNFMLFVISMILSIGLFVLFGKLFIQRRQYVTEN